MQTPTMGLASAGLSISVRMKSCALSAMAISPGLAWVSPLRTRSNALSNSCAKAATSSKPNIAPRALDRVQRAEGGVDEVAISRRGFEVEQRLFQAVEKLGGFLTKDFGGVGSRAHPINFLMTARSWSCLNGLVIQAVAPAALASRFRFSSDSVVRN